MLNQYLSSTADSAIAPWKVILLSNESDKKNQTNQQLEILEFDGVGCELLAAETPLQATELLQKNKDAAILLVALSPVKQSVIKINELIDKQAYPGLCVIAVLEDSGAQQSLLKSELVDQVVESVAAKSFVGAILTGLKWHQDISRLQLSQTLLNSIHNVNETSTGDAYLKEVVSNLAKFLGVKFVFIGEADSLKAEKVVTRFVWAGKKIVDNFEYKLAGTPCHKVLCGKRVIAFPEGVAKQFADDLMLSRMGVESYMGAAIISPAGEIVGILVAMDNRPMINTRVFVPVFDFFASRAGVELERQRTEDKLRKLNKELLQVAHQATMADISAGVMHDVANVFNSMAVTCQMMQQSLLNSKLPRLADAADLLIKNKDRLASYITEDEKGHRLPEYFCKLSAVLNEEADKYKENLNALLDSSNLVKEELRCQLDFVKLSTQIEQSNVQVLVQKVLVMQAASMHRHHIRIERNFEDVPQVKIQKNKFVNVLTNMLKNARQAMAEIAEAERKLDIAITNNGDGYVHISVTDRGVGLSVQSRQSVFTLGYTTKKNGHGIGLHVSANYMADMGGYIKISSPGINLGATVTLGLAV